MVDVSSLGRKAWRAWFTDGVPSSGAHEPLKSEIFDFVKGVDQQKVQFFANIDELRAYEGEAISGLLVGRIALGDGGDGPVAVIAGDTTTADNGATVFVDGLGRRWGRAHDGRFDPRWWDFTAEDKTSAYNGALAAIQARGGGTLVIPPFTHTVNGPLTYTGDLVSVVGDGYNSLIQKKSTTGDLFAFDGDKYRFHGFLIECPGVHTSGTLFRLNTVGGNVSITEVFSHQGFGILTLGYGAQLYVNNCTFNAYRGHGLRPGPNWGGLTVIVNVNMNCDEANQGTGVHLESGDTFHLTNINCAGQLQPLVFKPQANGVLVNVFCTTVFGDGIGRTATGFDGWLIDGSAASCTLGRIFMTGCWAGVNRRDGLRIIGAVSGDVVKCVNCYFLSNLGHGVYWTSAPRYIELEAGTISGNSLLSPGTYSGIRVDDFASEFRIDSCRIGPTGLVTVDNHAYNVDIAGTNHDHYRVRDNDLRGGVTGVMRDQGTGSDKTIRDNAGYKTASKGAATITSGNTSVTVSHNLAVTPTAADIVITFTEQATNDYGRWWVGSINGSSFNLNVTTDPGASNLDFSWSARCLQ